MWKTIILTLLISTSVRAAEESAHLQELKNLFPHALLTDDFGILNKDDLKISQCIAAAVPFSESRTSSYPYWQCFEAKDAKMNCEGKKYSAEDKSRMTMLVISGERNGGLNEFISRRPMKLSMCRLYQKDWKKFTKDEKHICISGDFIEPEIDETGKKKLVWIFDRYKTKKGCDSYFQEACVLKVNKFCDAN
jgi:hypothetical protein